MSSWPREHVLLGRALAGREKTLLSRSALAVEGREWMLEDQ